MRLLRHFALRRSGRIAALVLTTALLAPAPGAHAQTSPRPETAAPGSAATGGKALTDTQALDQARRTGKPVPIPTHTTATTSVTAQPGGGFTLTEAAVPVRKLVGASWQPLDATLVRTADGAISPKLSNSGLRLSGGGRGPLATMASGTHSLSLTLPAPLPAPTLSGATATYREVVPGVDLVVTATALGAFSDVFVVKNAAAAASPALAALLTAEISGPELTVTADGDGNLTAKTATGAPVFAAAAPTLWDSAGSAPATGPSPLSAAAARSSAVTPGHGAHIGRLAPTLAGRNLTLSPDKGVLSGAHTDYPVYIDPTWGPTSKTGWASVAAQFPSQTYWNKSAESAGYMAVGYTSDLIATRTLINFSIPVSTLSGSTISGATFYVWNTYSGACPTSGQNQTVDVDAPSTTLTSANAKWSSWDTSGEVGGTIGSKSFAYGYSSAGVGGSSSCTTGGASVGITLGATTFANDVSAGRTTQTLALVAENESNIYGWKLLNPNTAQLTIAYDHAPTITSQASNASTACTQAHPGVLGKGGVNLTAGVFDADGDTVTAEFGLYNSSHSIEYNPQSTTGGTTGTTSPVSAGSGTKAVLTVPAAFFTGLGVTSATTFSWTVYDNDGTYSSAVSTCYFTYDPTSPGAPTVTDAAGFTCPSSTTTQTYTIGASAAFTITDANTTTGVPGSYTYQLNGAAPISVTAASSSPYTASITLKPTRGTNILTVTAVSAGGNIGQTQPCTFQAGAASSSDKDLTGDGLPDLLTVGTGSTPMAAGLWLAAEQNSTGAVSAAPTDIGANGDGVTGDDRASDFTGAQAITGAFTADGLQDVLTYYPSGLRAGELDVYNASGDGSPLASQYAGNQHGISSGGLTDANGDLPQQLANAYTAATSATNPHPAYPDLLGLGGDAANGYNLSYYPNGGGSVAFARGVPIGTYNSTSGTFTPLATPANGTDWNNWRVASDQIGGSTWVFLWNTGTKALYLWKNFTVDGFSDFSDSAVDCTVAVGPDLCTASYTQYQISASWNPGTLQTLEAADVNGDGTADLWAVTASGTATAYIVSSLTGTPALTAGTAQPLSTATHSWALNDTDSDGAAATAAADNTAGTALPMTGAGDVAWNTDDLFSPDVQFNGVNGRLYTSTTAMNLADSFTISAWANPSAYGGSVLAQDGPSDVGVTLYASANGWVFSVNTGAGTTNSYDTITGGTVQLGVWTHVTATFDKTTKVLSLYVDDVFVAYGNHTAPATGAAGAFVVGFDGTRYFAGQVAQAQAWSGVALAPPQPYTPAAYHQSVVPTRILDTRGTNVGYSDNPPSTPVAAGSTTALKIVGDTVTPSTSGGPTAIPATATAVAIDVTVTAQTSNGNITAYADGTERPITSSTNFVTGVGATGYQIVPIGLDGKIALYNSSAGTTHLIVDLTGYFYSTANAAQAGNQTYHPLDPSQRALATANGIANTNLAAVGKVPANTTFTLQITGQTGVPANATAVAANLTTYSQTGDGYLAAYAAGTTAPAVTDLTYHTTDVAQMGADIPIGTGGKISIYNYGADTDLIVDIFGYYTNDSTGELYHTANPTRIVDTRSGVGTATGSTTPIPSDSTFSISQADIAHITTAIDPVPAAMLTVTDTTASGNINAYGTTKPVTSNDNWTTSASTVANLALSPLSSGDTINVYLDSPGTIQLVVDCSGFFAAD